MKLLAYRSPLNSTTNRNGGKIHVAEVDEHGNLVKTIHEFLDFDDKPPLTLPESFIMGLYHYCKSNYKTPHEEGDECSPMRLSILQSPPDAHTEDYEGYIRDLVSTHLHPTKAVTGVEVRRGTEGKFWVDIYQR